MASDKHDTHGGAQPHTPPPPPDKPPESTVPPVDYEALAAGSVGAQVILDFNGDGSLGARGGAGLTIEENAAKQQAHYIALGLDPQAPSGPPLAPEVIKAKQDADKKVADAHASVQEAKAKSGGGKATRVSSLAAGILTGDAGSATPAKH